MPFVKYFGHSLTDMAQTGFMFFFNYGINVYVICRDKVLRLQSRHRFGIIQVETMVKLAPCIVGSLTVKK